MTATSSDVPLHERRRRLRTVSVTGARHFAIVTLRAQAGASAVRLRYVPDRDLLEPDSFQVYLDALDTAGTPPEAAAETILDDINDQVIPCWLEVCLTRDGKVAHEVRIEDRQPRWDDKGLLDRLGP